MKRKRIVTKDMISSVEAAPLYVGVDIHERESQLAVFEQDGTLVMEKRIPTGSLESFIGSLPGEKHVAIESVGFIYPIYDRLSKLSSCHVAVADPAKRARATQHRDNHLRFSCGTVCLTY